jgi:protein-S-isoprenylcysteine O-methyltransferase Ste14
MNADAVFRPYVIAIFVIVMMIALPFRIKSQSTGEKLDRMQEGLLILVALRLAGAALWFGAIAFMINPAWMAWASLPFPNWIRWAGVAMGLVTPLLLLWTLKTLGPNLTDTVVTRQSHTLVTRGPYRWVRHPFYDCMALFVLSLGLVAANWFVLAAGVVVFTLLAVRTRIEEEKLLARFGDPYRAYLARTGRFLPVFLITLER